MHTQKILCGPKVGSSKSWTSININTQEIREQKEITPECISPEVQFCNNTAQGNLEIVFKLTQHKELVSFRLNGRKIVTSIVWEFGALQNIYNLHDLCLYVLLMFAF